MITGLDLASWWGNRPSPGAVGSRDEVRGLVALCCEVVAVLEKEELLSPRSVAIDDRAVGGEPDDLEALLLAEVAEGDPPGELVVTGTTRIIEPSGVDRIVDEAITVTAIQSNAQLVAIAVFEDAFMAYDVFGAPQPERHARNAPRLRRALEEISTRVGPLSPMSTKRATPYGFELRNHTGPGWVVALEPNVLRRDGEGCSLFLTDQIVMGARLRAGSGDEVRAGYLAGAPESPLLITLTQRHAAPIVRLREELAHDLAGIAPLAWLGDGPSDGIPYDDVLVEALPHGARVAPRRMAEAEARALGAACADVLARAGRWIGGLCPDTIYVDADGRFATLAPRGPRFIASAPQHLRGPRSYPVPYEPFEVLALGQAPSAASDVFALCATLFTLVAGRHPFGNATDEILARVLAQAPDRRPGPLGDLLARGLAADPAHRPTAAELASLLAG